MENRKPPILFVIIAFATVYVVWGSTYFFIQKAVHEIPPFLMGFMRFVTAGLLLLGWCALRGEKVLDRAYILPSAVTGFMLLFVGNGAVIWAEQYIPSVIVAIMVSSSPIWFVLFDRSKWSINFNTPSTIIGLLIGFAGVILLFWNQLSGGLSGGGDQHRLPAILLLLLASMSWSAGSLYSKYNSKGGSAAISTGWQMLFGGLAFLPGSVILQEWTTISWSAVSFEAWSSLVYLILMGSIAAFSAYVWLLQVRPATQVSTYAYVNPVIAVLLGVLFANESVSAIQIAGLAIILGSVLLINLTKYRGIFKRS